MGAQYGSYSYESTESRALKSITADSYNKDQAKNLIQLNQNSEYMAQYLRKLQKGVDDANQNFIEQIQSFINDIIVLIGGGGNTGLDFGDLKYVFMAIGSLFGFTNESGEIQLPVNLFNAAWHFFSSYILPGANFDEVINSLIDQAIAQILDIFGDIPIIGEALQQFAVIISDLRDALAPLITAVEGLFNAFGGDWTIGDLGIFTDLFNAITTLFSPLIGPPIEFLAQIFGVMVQWSMPFIEALTDIVDVATNIIRSITGGLSFDAFTNGNFNLFGMISQIVDTIVKNIVSFPLGLLTNNPGPNLLVQPNFDDSDSVSMGTGWSWDGTTGRTTVGSAKASPNGLGSRELTSVPIPVEAGQVMTVVSWLKWSGIAYSGTNPIKVRMNKYLNGAYIGSDVVAQVGTPATNQNTWQQFNGTFNTPSGVDRIRLSFYVESTMTAGNVWFDDAEVRKTGSTLPQSWISGLLDSLGGLGDFIQGVIDTFISIIRGIPFVGGTLADLLEQFAGQSHAIVTNTATTNQILAAFGPGNPDADDFERVSAVDLGTKWTIYKTGTVTVSTANGHDASANSPYANTAEYLAISDTKAAGDNQQAAVVLTSAPDTAVPPFLPKAYASDDIWLRVPDSVTSWATRTGLRCRITAEKKVSLSWFLNGVETVLLAPTAFTIAPTGGTSFTYEAGYSNTPRRHYATLNGTPIMDFSEAGTVSQIGGRRRAFGGKNISANTQANSSSYKQWTAQG